MEQSLDLSDRSGAVADLVDLHARALEHRQQHVGQRRALREVDVLRRPSPVPQARPIRAVGSGYWLCRLLLLMLLPYSSSE